MEVNNGQIIYPQNLKKYSGTVYGIKSKAKNNNNEIVSFRARIKIKNFKYSRYFQSRQEAEEDLIRINIENKLDIKNLMQDCGEYYKVKLYGNKEFLADKCDLHFIEAYIWRSTNNNYVTTNQDGKHVQFHNLILDHSPVMNCTVDHIDRDPKNNRRSNLRLVNKQTQAINRNPRNNAIQQGVHLDRNCWKASWTDEFNNAKTATFNINRFGYEIAKQLAITKRLEMELSLNHYRLALHNLPPLIPDEIEPEIPDGVNDEPVGFEPDEFEQKLIEILEMPDEPTDDEISELTDDETSELTDDETPELTDDETPELTDDEIDPDYNFEESNEI